jgi:bacterioferritin-associated ferredoxin
VQFKLHEGLAAVVAADPTHELLQIIAEVSQLITQALVVDVSGSNCGCGAGCTTCASLIRSVVSPNAMELPATNMMHNGRTYRIESSPFAPAEGH